MAIALAMHHDQLLVGFDGGYVRDLARRQFQWGVPIFKISIDFFQGVGDVFFSGANFTLLPSFFAGSFFGTGATAKVVTYTVSAMEIVGASMVFARTLGLGRTEAVAAALMLPLLMFPLYGVGAIYPILALTPNAATYIAASLLMSSAFLRFGRRGIRKDLPYAVLMLATAIWLVHAAAVTLVTAGPSLLLAGVAGIIAARDWQERRLKLGLALVAAVVFAGPFLYLLGLLLNTASITAPTELANNRLTIEHASILFHWSTFGPAGPILVGAAIFGALISAFDRSRPILRVFAITLLTYLTSRLTFWALTVLFDFWRGPSALYFEFFVYPLYAVFAITLVSRVAGYVATAVGRRPSDLSLRSGLVAGTSGLAILMAWVSPAPNFLFHYPPKPTALTPMLQSEVGMRRPAAFRGRVATLTGRSLDRGVTWHDLHGLDALLERNFGNEMRLVGLNYFGIPGLFQYGSTMTSAFYAVTSRLLSDPRDTQLRSVSVLRRYEPALLAMLGVRFVVTDAPLAGMTPVSRAESSEQNLYLFEVPNPNLGNYSPTDVHAAESATAVLTRMGRPDFDPAREVVASVPGGATGLTEARDTSLAFDGASLVVRATSEGRSVLLLPLEFSRCLAITARSGEPTLFRANLLLTGMEFSGRLDATIALRAGPFVNPTCRLSDFRELLAAGIRDLPKNVRNDSR